MLAEVASSKACQMIEGTVLPLRAPDRPAIRTGTLWIRHCEITNDGTDVTFALSGNGWQWADQTKHQAGGTFVVREYVKFDVQATVHGALDLAYDRRRITCCRCGTRRASRPRSTSSRSARSRSIARGCGRASSAALSSAIGSSPDEQGTHQAKQQGTHQFETSLADGLTVAVGMCTGYQRFTLGRAPKGSLGPPDPGESPRDEVELHAGGLAIFGPQPAPDGMTIDVDTTGGPRASGSRAPTARTRSPTRSRTRGSAGSSTRSRRPTSPATLICTRRPRTVRSPVIAQPLAPNVTLAWQRPPAERAKAFGGSLVQCRAK